AHGEFTAVPTGLPALAAIGLYPRDQGADSSLFDRSYAMIRLATAILASVLCAFTLALPAAAQRTLTPDEEFALQEISQHNSEIRTMAGRFVQIDSQGGRIEGTFWLKRPNMVRFRYAPPSREEIISQGSGFYVIDRQQRTQYAYSQEHVPLRQFLGDTVSLINSNLSDVVMSETHLSV